MKTIKRLRFRAFYASLALFAALALGTQLGNQASAAGVSSRGDKVSQDLREKVKGAQSGERVSVVVQPVSTWGSSLTSDLTSKNGTLKRTFKNFTARIVELPASQVDALANRSDVKSITLDREVKLLGHLSLTTGAEAARAMGGSTSYDGTGIGIVVIDSGIDPRHVALNDGSSKTRIVANVDFTGENRTDDPYGHGTHVAAIAAGNGNVAQGAYIGIAPNARIINLRTLNSQGKGTVSGLLAALDWVMTNRSNPAYNIRVVNLSLGTAAVDSYLYDPLCQAVRRLVDAGVVVVAAAGNEGKDSYDRKI